MGKIEELMMKYRTHLVAADIHLYYAVNATDMMLLEDGWRVITWKKRKPVWLYVGKSFDEAIKVFQDALGDCDVR